MRVAGSFSNQTIHCMLLGRSATRQYIACCWVVQQPDNRVRVAISLSSQTKARIACYWVVKQPDNHPLHVAGS